MWFRVGPQSGSDRQWDTDPILSTSDQIGVGSWTVCPPTIGVPFAGPHWGCSFLHSSRSAEKSMGGRPEGGGSMRAG